MRYSMNNVLNFFLLLTASSVTCNGTSPLEIIGGKDAKIEDYPYQVGLTVDGDFLCGASIISPTWLLTAAHCLDGESPQTLQVFANSTRINSGVFVSVNRTITHEKFIYGVEDYDIGLIQLAKPLACIYCKSIKLAKTDPKLGDNAIVTGWGKVHEMDDPVGHEILQTAKVAVLDQKLCAEWYKVRNKVVTERMFCAGYPNGGIDACQGDSGGPITDGGVLVGVTSWGLGCGEPQLPGVYTKVAAYLDWIEKHSGITVR